MPQYAFGAGQLFGRSNDNSPATPVPFGALQGVSIDIAFSTKELYGRKQFPIALARGTGKITGKADYAQFDAAVFNELFFGNTSAAATGSVRTVTAEAVTITANAATAVNGGNFVSDLGVTRASDGSVYGRVVSGPVGLQYSCNETTGVYAFNSSQNNVPVLLAYTWNSSATGKKMTINNGNLGASPTFLCVFQESFNGQEMTLVLNKCMSSKLSLATKLEDFVQPNFDFMAYADGAGNVGTLSLE
jgi:hypothetical protein